MKKKEETTLHKKLTPYRVLIKPALTVWLWIMPMLSLQHSSIAPFYVATVLSTLLSLAVWNHERVHEWAAHYMHTFLYPLKKPVKLYDLAVQIFIFSMFIGLSISIFVGIAVLTKLLFV